MRAQPGQARNTESAPFVPLTLLTDAIASRSAFTLRSSSTCASGLVSDSRAATTGAVTFVVAEMQPHPPIWRLAAASTSEPENASNPGNASTNIFVFSKSPLLSFIPTNTPGKDSLSLRTRFSVNGTADICGK